MAPLEVLASRVLSSTFIATLLGLVGRVAMSKRSFEMYQYRQVLVRMRQVDSHREIARDRLMGRKKSWSVWSAALEQGWLESAQPLPVVRSLNSN